MHFRPVSSRPERRSRWRRRAAVAAAAAGTSVLLAPAAFAATGWTVATVPQTGNNTLLTAASARTGSDAWAVGEQFTAAGQAPAPPVSYHWTGSAWSLVPTASLGTNTPGVLLAVSAAAANDAWAVGFSSPQRDDESTLFEHWNGSAWSVNTSLTQSGEVAQLTGVVDVSPGNAWAVGRGRTGTLLAHWNGTSWASVPLPDPGFQPGSGESMSATSASDIWLVGTSINAGGNTVAEALHFNGSAWSVSPMAQPSQGTASISAVTALSASNAWAVGTNGGSTLIEHWTGSGWSVVPSPTPGADPSLTGVAARGPSDVYAVGSSLPSINGGVVQGIILRWNGSSWLADTDPTTGSYSPLFAAAAAPGAANEWAAGTLSNQSLILSHP